MRTLLTALALAALAPSAAAETVVETYPDGAVKAKYVVDEDGIRNGNYTEYFPSGQLKVRAQYQWDRLQGFYSSYHENGQLRVTAKYQRGKINGEYLERDEEGRPHVVTTYAMGVLDGKYDVFDGEERVSRQVWKEGVLRTVNGVVAHPKSHDKIVETLEKIFNTGFDQDGERPDETTFGRLEALRWLMAYRYLCDVPHKGIELDKKMNEHAAAAARLCEKIGKLDHTPPNPGMPEEEYLFAYHGTSHSNLHVGGPVETSVRAYMDDSDERNIDRVGHRRWCLNPRLLKVGFGESGKYTAMYAHDASRKQVPDIDYVSYPPRGLLPVAYFEPHYAWSVSLNARKFKAPSKGGVNVTVRRLGDDYRPGAQLEIDYFNVSNKAMGMKYCIIFRPKGVVVEPGARYWVEIEGLLQGNDDVTLRYLVEFFEL